MRLLLGRLYPLIALISSLLLIQDASGQPETADSTTAPVMVRGTEVREFDLAKLQARARVAYVSSGARTLSGRMIDDDLQTVFRFSESDSTPTVIVELAKSAQLHRVSTVFKAEDAKLDVYLLSEFPKNMSDLQFAKPDASVVGLPDERGMVTVNVSVSSARFVALRWKRKKSNDPFTVAEISAFSNNPTDWVPGADVHLASNSASNLSQGPIPTIPSVPTVSP